MRLSRWVSARWREVTMAPEQPPAVVPGPDPKPRVPAQYMALHSYLEHRYASMIVLTFEQIESLLGFTLPEPACTERAWWTGETPAADRHLETWTLARRTATPNLLAKTVAFERLP